MAEGRVKFFKEDRGWGAIESDEVPGDVWVHYSALDMDGYRSLAAGDVVEFEHEAVQQDSFAFRATRVRRLRSGPAPVLRRRGGGVVVVPEGTPDTPLRPRHTVRPVAPAEVAGLQAIEDAADRALVALLRPDAWEPAPPGSARTAGPGFVLVAEEDAAVVGFAHVLEVEGLAHLEQLAVLPEHGRRGHGRALVEAAKREAARRGSDRITLRTYADVPFNAPFYRSCGFVESEPDAPFLRDLVAVEAPLGLDRWGRRVQMTAPLGGTTAI